MSLDWDLGLKVTFHVSVLTAAVGDNRQIRRPEERMDRSNHRSRATRTRRSRNARHRAHAAPSLAALRGVFGGSASFRRAMARAHALPRPARDAHRAVLHPLRHRANHGRSLPRARPRVERQRTFARAIPLAFHVWNRRCIHRVVAKDTAVRACRFFRIRDLSEREARNLP